jgi:hypothetical protein
MIDHIKYKLLNPNQRAAYTIDHILLGGLPAAAASVSAASSSHTHTRQNTTHCKHQCYKQGCTRPQCEHTTTRLHKAHLLLQAWVACRQGLSPTPAARCWHKGQT